MSQKVKETKAAPVEIFSGDTVRVHVKIREDAGKVRIQTFEGTVISKRGSGISETFAVRRISYGEGVERTFPLHSPNIDQIELIRRGSVRRAKLFYLRGRKGKNSRIKESKTLPSEREGAAASADV